jgi:hypothetical protein
MPPRELILWKKKGLLEDHTFAAQACIFSPH